MMTSHDAEVTSWISEPVQMQVYNVASTQEPTQAVQNQFEDRNALL